MLTRYRNLSKKTRFRRRVFRGDLCVATVDYVLMAPFQLPFAPGTYITESETTTTNLLYVILNLYLNPFGYNLLEATR
ncbi:hypothetical protein GWI33_022170 [Rhynchophorus ferrugineus]|uniref:Uncharacterized protein n=1 Tax=Rhynchophorus ferrugineus TaxID=354439 RepID=A0A834MI03_RHYFE|nr:hypothetical protein GWI33_022170 [Rhynchophorus ferrugineus]